MFLKVWEVVCRSTFLETKAKIKGSIEWKENVDFFAGRIGKSKGTRPRKMKKPGVEPGLSYCGLIIHFKICVMNFVPGKSMFVKGFHEWIWIKLFNIKHPFLLPQSF